MPRIPKYTSPACTSRCTYLQSTSLGHLLLEVSLRLSISQTELLIPQTPYCFVLISVKHGSILPVAQAKNPGVAVYFSLLSIFKLPANPISSVFKLYIHNLVFTFPSHSSFPSHLSFSSVHFPSLRCQLLTKKGKEDTGPSVSPSVAMCLGAKEMGWCERGVCPVSVAARPGCQGNGTGEQSGTWKRQPECLRA